MLFSLKESCTHMVGSHYVTGFNEERQLYYSWQRKTRHCDQKQ